MVQQFPEDHGWFPAPTRDSSQQPTTPLLRDPTAISLPKSTWTRGRLSGRHNKILEEGAAAEVMGGSGDQSRALTVLARPLFSFQHPHGSSQHICSWAFSSNPDHQASMAKYFYWLSQLVSLILFVKTLKPHQKMLRSDIVSKALGQKLHTKFSYVLCPSN